MRPLTVTFSLRVHGNFGEFGVVEFVVTLLTTARLSTRYPLFDYKDEFRACVINIKSFNSGTLLTGFRQCFVLDEMLLPSAKFA